MWHLIAVFCRKIHKDAVGFASRPPRLLDDCVATVCSARRANETSYDLIPYPLSKILVARLHKCVEFIVLQCEAEQN